MDMDARYRNSRFRSGRQLHSPLFTLPSFFAVDEVIPPAIRSFTPLSGHPFSRSVLRPSPCRRRGTAIAVDEVSMGKSARYCQSSLRSGRLVLPLEGKGDRSAVDEVTCSPAPLRGASCTNARTPAIRRPASTSLSGLWSLVTCTIFNKKTAHLGRFY